MPKRKKRGGPGRPKAAQSVAPADDSGAGHARRRSSAGGGGGGGSVDSIQHPPASCPEYGPGWTVQVIPRKGGGRKAVDRWYRAPDGRKFRSAREVERFLAARRERCGAAEAGAAAAAAAAAAAGGGEDAKAANEAAAGGEEKKAAAAAAAAAEEAANNHAADAVQDEAREDAKDDDNDEEDKPLDSPSTNIRMRVKMSSFDILGVDADPLNVNGKAEATTTGGKVLVKKHVTKSGEALFDDSDSSSSSSDDDEEETKAKDRGNDGKPTAAEAAVAPTHREALFDAFGGSDDEDDDLLGLEPSPKDDDSAYTESNNGGDDDSEDLDDDAEEEFVDEEEKGKPRARSGSRGGSGAPSSPRQTQWKNSLVNKRVRVVSGYWKGKKGTVVEHHYGWYTLDPSSGVNTAVRAKELEVLGENHKDDAAVNADADEARDDLIGATVRVKGGNYAGMEGTVNEVMRYRHVQIDALPDQLVHLSHVELLSPPPPPERTAHVEANEGSTTEADLTAQFQGARVRITKPHDKAGTEGIAAKVVVGQWYVMDNPNVKVAQRDHNLAVVAWRPDVAARKERGGVVEEGSGGGAEATEGAAEGTGAANEGDAPNEDERPPAPKPTRKQEKLAAQWNEKYALLVEHTRARGTANMPCTHKTDDGVALGKWLENQKSLCAANKLLVDRYERLRALGVTFNTVGSRYRHATAGEPASPAEAASPYDPDVEAAPHNESTKESSGNGERVDSGAGDKKPAANPLLGATVYVGRGTFQGLQGKIAIIHSRGWWTLDNPLVTGKVKCADCRFIDDGTYDLGAIEDWYDVAGRARMPRVVKPGREGAGAKSILRENSAAGGDDVRDGGPSTMFKRKIDETDFTGGDVAKRRKELGVVAGGVPSNDGRGSQRPRNHRPKTRGGNTPALNPILVQPCDDSPGTEARLKLQLLPEGLRHLPVDAKVEIFNRRTGRIMKGDQAILLSDLPAALMDHAEYEPIVPPPPNSSVSTRIGRSGPNVRVNRNVVPQTRVRGSKVEGRSVLVTGGEYRGLSGTIDSCIPGGWYLVSGLFRAGDSMDAVINSKHLELIPERITIRDSTPSEARSMKRTRIHLKAAKLRLEAVLEEQTKLENSGDAPHVQLSEVDLHVNRARKRVADLERNLAKIVSDEFRSSMEQKLKEAKTNEPEDPPKALAPGGGAVHC